MLDALSALRSGEVLESLVLQPSYADDDSFKYPLSDEYLLEKSTLAEAGAGGIRYN